MQFWIVIALGMIILADELPKTGLIGPGLSGVVGCLFPILTLVLFWIRSLRKRIFAELEFGTFNVGYFQKIYVRAQRMLRTFAIIAHFLLLYFTDWSKIVRGIVGYNFWGADEFVIILPFVSIIMIGYCFLYQADRAIREVMLSELMFFSEPIRPVWTRREYLLFHLRMQILFIGLPLMLIISFKDAIDRYHKNIIQAGQVVLGENEYATLLPEFLLIFFVCVVFLFSPFIIRFVWLAKRFPDGQLREELNGMIQRLELHVRDILLWPSYGIIVNAAVVGFIGKLRYIMLSDGLIESLTDEQIKGVFAHEAGHIKLHHLRYYLAFVFVIASLVGIFTYFSGGSVAISSITSQTLIFLGFIVIWFFVFGYISRRFEREADLFAVETLSDQIDRKGQCSDSECPRCKTNIEYGDVKPICITAIKVFVTALKRTAALNAVPSGAKSWRHGSVDDRCEFLMQISEDITKLLSFKSEVKRIKVGILFSALFVFIYFLSLCC